jgi:hypothetical protein
VDRGGGGGVERVLVLARVRVRVRARVRVGVRVRVLPQERFERLAVRLRIGMALLPQAGGLGGRIPHASR